MSHLCQQHLSTQLLLVPSSSRQQPWGTQPELEGGTGAGDCVWARTAEGWLGNRWQELPIRKARNSSGSCAAMCQTALPSPGTAAPRLRSPWQGPRNPEPSQNRLENQQQGLGKALGSGTAVGMASSEAISHWIWPQSSAGNTSLILITKHRKCTCLMAHPKGI